MKYKKIPVKGYKALNMFPVYVEGINSGKEPFKIVGIREKEVELETSFFNGVNQRVWFNQEIVFVVREVCEERLKPGSCQVDNVNCCGGGYILVKHINYWDSLVPELF